MSIVNAMLTISSLFSSSLSGSVGGLLQGSIAATDFTHYRGGISGQEVWVVQSPKGEFVEGSRFFLSSDGRRFHQLQVAESRVHAFLARTPHLPSMVLVKREDSVDLLINDPKNPEILLEGRLTTRLVADLLPEAAFYVFSDGEVPPFEGALKRWWSGNVAGAAAIEPIREAQKDRSFPLLYIEDDMVIAMAMSDQLKDLGFTGLLEASRGSKALEIFQKHPDLRVVLSDYDLGRNQKTGLELAREMRSMRPGIRVLFISSQTREIEERLTVEERECFSVVPKYMDAKAVGLKLLDLAIGPANV